MAALEDVLNRVVNPGVAIPGAARKAEEERQRQLDLQAAEKARVAARATGAAAAAPLATSAVAPTVVPAVAPTVVPAIAAQPPEYASDRALRRQSIIRAGSP